MLSIGKLVAGAEDYYLSMVAEGLEEYYTGSGEAPGTWVGAGTDALELAGTVEPAALQALLTGTSPGDGLPLGARRNDPRGRVAGFDLTFSPPKSVSVLYGLADAPTSSAVRAAHDRAVADGLCYLERHATMARRGAGGQTRIGTGGLVGAAFVHRTSRAGDPQLHTHVLAANAVLGADGRWSAPDARLLYFHARTAGYLYQASLRAGLVESLGVRFGPVVKGAAEVAGLDAEVLRGFSGRRSEIVEYLFARGGSSSRRIAELAALATRQPKESAPSSGHLRARWREKATDLGADLGHLFERSRPHVVVLGERAMAALSVDLLGSHGLTACDSVFERRDVVRAIAERLGDGARLDQIEAAVDLVVGEREVVTLPMLGRGGEAVQTTHQLLSLEADMLRRAVAQHQGSSSARLDPATVSAALAAHADLAPEQRAMVERLTTSGAGLDVVVGQAGSGKTTSLAVARRLFAAAGYEVMGTALSARAAAELTSSAGIESVTLARFLGETEGATQTLGDRHVVVVDEAGMVGTRTLARLLELAEQAGSKLVLVGDPAQLPEIEAGGAFGALASRVGVIELTENRRQRAPWERVALDQLRRGESAAALGAYVVHDRVSITERIADARAAMVRTWLESRGSGAPNLMLAVGRADVDALNALARTARQDRGELGDDVVATEARGFALGDEVLCRRNARRLGVLNGTRGTVLGWDGRRLDIETPEGVVSVPRGYLEAGHLHHGYASTVHLAQGLTCQRVFVLGTEALSREAGYVALSRARTSAQLFVVAGSFEDGHVPERMADVPLALTAARLARSRAKHLASDVLDDAPPREIPRPLAPASGFNSGGRWEGYSVPTVAGPFASEFSGLEPPVWVRAALGVRPGFVDEQGEDDDLAAAITAYRAKYGIEGDDPLGPRPSEPGHRLAYDVLAAQIRTNERRLVRRREAPGLDVGLGR